MTSESVLSGLSEYSDDTLANIELGQHSLDNIEEVITEEVANENDSPDPEEQVESENTEINNQNQTKEKPAEKSNEPRLTQLPLSRIKNLMKLDPDLQISSAEATFMVAKATELFIDSLAKESFLHTAQQKKKTMQKRDVDMAVASVDSLMFLDGALNF